MSFGSEITEQVKGSLGFVVSDIHPLVRMDAWDTLTKEEEIGFRWFGELGLVRLRVRVRVLSSGANAVRVNEKHH